jgi:hypothetical protein
MRTFNGLEGAFSAGLGALDAGWRGMESILLLIPIELCLVLAVINANGNGDAVGELKL